jgi:hypothetical protein
MAENSPNGQKWQLLGLGVGAFSALCTVLAALIGAGFFVGHVTASATKPGAATATVTVTVTATATAPASRPAPNTTSTPVYYQGKITIGNNNIDFDSKPPGPGPSTAAFYYNGFALITSSSTGGFAIWKQGTPTASECKSFVPANLINELPNIVNGMQICFRTDQGRFGLLSVKAGTIAYELRAYAIVWGP